MRHKKIKKIIDIVKIPKNNRITTTIIIII